MNLIPDEAANSRENREKMYASAMGKKATAPSRARAAGRNTKTPLPNRTAALKKYLEARKGTTIHPMGPPRSASPSVNLYKVMGKMFAVLSLRGDEYVILKCDPHLAEMLRGQYSGVGHRSHLDRRFWIAVSLDADVPSAEVKRLAAHSYDLVRSGLTKKQQAELARTT